MVAHSGEEIGSWVEFESDPCSECSKKQASARADPMMSRLSEERPVKVTYVEQPLLSPMEPCERLQIRRPSPDERRQARQEKSHGIIQGLLALAFCILSTFFICAVASFLGFTQGRGASELVAPLQKRTPERFTEKMTQKQAFLQRTTRVKGN